MSKKMYFLISFVLVLSLAGNVLAYDTINWDNENGTGDRLWQTATNWHTGTNQGKEWAPLAKDWVLIEDYADANSGPIVNADTNAVALWIDMGYYAPVSEAVLTIEGGTVTCTGSWALGYYQPGTYRLDISGGTVNAGASLWIGYTTDSYATLNMSGGTLNTTGNLAIGTVNAAQADVNMTGGDVNNPGWFRIGDFAGRTGKGHVDLHGGTISTGLADNRGRLQDAQWLPL
jgi:hypothetical protein